MKVLYAARMARFDLLRVVCGLACCVTKWDAQCDRRLHRLMCYINSSLHVRMVGWMGDPIDKVGLHLYADADFAGDLATSRSTSGVFLCVRGEDSFMGLAGISKRQTCVSHSTPESEIVAADAALRLVGLPALQLWDRLLPQPAHILFHEDNQAMIRICETGRNPTMRHLGRTHRVDVAWLHERFASPDVTLQYVVTDEQCADIFTKGFQRPRQMASRVHLNCTRGPCCVLGNPRAGAGGGGVSVRFGRFRWREPRCGGAPRTVPGFQWREKRRGRPFPAPSARGSAPRGDHLGLPSLRVARRSTLASSWPIDLQWRD